MSDILVSEIVTTKEDSVTVRETVDKVILKTELATEVTNLLEEKKINESIIKSKQDRNKEIDDLLLKYSSWINSK